MSKHNHHWVGCSHDNLKFCKHCDVPYCADCGKEWFTYQNPYKWYFNGITYLGGTTPAYSASQSVLTTTANTPICGSSHKVQGPSTVTGGNDKLLCSHEAK